MKIRNIKDINFKSQMLDKYVSKTSFPKASIQQQSKAPIGTFNQFAYQLNQPLVANESESNLEEKKLSNNIQFAVDTNSQSNKTVMQIKILQTKESEQNLAAFEILRKMLGNIETEKRPFEAENYNYITSSDGVLLGEIEAKKDNFMELFNSLINTILSPDLSEEDFNYAKSELIYRRKHDKSQASLQTTNAYPSLEELKKITLDDVKKLHTNLLVNSQTKVSLTASGEFCKENESKIIGILEKYFPKMSQ